VTGFAPLKLVHGPSAPPKLGRRCHFCAGSMSAIEMHHNCPEYRQERTRLQIKLNRIRSGELKKLSVRARLSTSVSKACIIGGSR
jgi:hypothetical protein